MPEEKLNSVEQERKRICDEIREKYARIEQEKRKKLQDKRDNDLRKAVIEIQAGRKPKNSKKY